MPVYQLSCTSCARLFEVDKSYGTAYCPHCGVINMVVNAVEVTTPTAPPPVEQPAPAPIPPAPRQVVAAPCTVVPPVPTGATPQEAVQGYLEWYKSAGYTTNPFGVRTGFEPRHYVPQVNRVTRPLVAILDSLMTSKTKAIDEAIRSRFVRFIYTIEQQRCIHSQLRILEVDVCYQSMRTAVQQLNHSVWQQGQHITLHQVEEVLDRDMDQYAIYAEVQLEAYRQANGQWAVRPTNKGQELLLALALTGNIDSEIEDEDVEHWCQEPPAPEPTAPASYIKWGMWLMLAMLALYLILGVLLRW